MGTKRLSNLDKDNLRRLVVTYPAAPVGFGNALTFTIRAYTGHGSPISTADAVLVRVTNIDITTGAVTFAATTGTLLSNVQSPALVAAANDFYELEFRADTALNAGIIVFTANRAAAAAAAVRFTVRCGDAQANGTGSWT